MGYIVIICISFLLIFSSCKAPLSELRSTRQMWCLEENNLYGINYHFTLKTQANNLLIKLDSIRLHKKWIKDFHYSVLGKSNTETKFFKGDTILISVNILDTIDDRNIYINYTYKRRLKSIPIKHIEYLKNLCK